LRLSRHHLANGQTLTFRGRVGGTPRPAKGVVVALEVRKGRSWQPFHNTNTKRNGRFASSYRFIHTTAVQHYKFRARIPAQVGYPYDGGTSRPVAVVVHG
jgi:5-hydroxyisourate hydrolase-like protein (transthyretin family)